MLTSTRLQRFEKTNEMLVNCNTLSQVHLQKANLEFKKHSQLLNEVKKDLENIFKRIKVMKAKAAAQYPHQFEGYFCIFTFILFSKQKQFLIFLHCRCYE